MNMFARFDENPAMTLQDIKETKRYRRTHGHENSIPNTNKVCGGYNDTSTLGGSLAASSVRINIKIQKMDC